jgi:hypothetical protein
MYCEARLVKQGKPRYFFEQGQIDVGRCRHRYKISYLMTRDLGKARVGAVN